MFDVDHVLILAAAVLERAPAKHDHCGESNDPGQVQWTITIIGADKTEFTSSTTTKLTKVTIMRLEKKGRQRAAASLEGCLAERTFLYIPGCDQL